MRNPNPACAMKVFLTATDTGAGKTHLALALVRGMGVRAYKPLAAGVDAEGRNEDVAALAAAQGIPEDEVCFQCWNTPAAPAIAAAREKRPLDVSALLDWCRARLDMPGPVVLEGIGGVRVPLTWDFEVRDWIRALADACEVWLVAAARIGAINHTLLSLEALAAIGCAPTRVVINEPAPGLADAAQMLADALARMHRRVQCVHVRYGEDALALPLF